MPADGAVDEDGRRRTQGAERRDAADGATRRRTRRPRGRSVFAARTSSSGCSPVSARRTCRSASPAVRSTERTIDAKCGLVMSGTMTAMLPVRPVFIPERPGSERIRAAYGGFDAASGFRCHLLGRLEGARHRGRMHASAGRDVEDGDASGLSHGPSR